MSDKKSMQIALDLSTTSLETIVLFMDETADEAVFEEILAANRSRPEVITALYEHSETPQSVRAEAAGVLSLPVMSNTQIDTIRDKSLKRIQKQPREDRTQKLVQRVQKVGVSEKIKLALRGGTDVRKLLSRDPNKLVILGVIANPRITDSEIEAIARNRSVIEDALREIARNREWTKTYAIQLALVNNPKTPVGLAMPLVNSLKKRDIKQLEKNKNVSEAVRSTAKKFIKMSMGGGGGGGRRG